MASDPNPYRSLPSVDEVLSAMAGRLPRALLAEVARIALDDAREAIASGGDVDPWARLEDTVDEWARMRVLPMVNASGVLLHTNLGRAAWSKRARDRALLAASGASNLEIDLDDGARGKRGRYVAELLHSLTGAEDALIVNNNASAVLLTLAATSSGRTVPVSRGELIEIGGAYRLPEVMKASGSKLAEVGTTNKTRLDDYRVALQLHDCGAILKVHPSNYRVTGFTSEATVADLALLGGEAGVPLIHDIGSGLLDDEAAWLPRGLPEWLGDEPSARGSVAGGASLVCFSGDKLLGGPQAGIIVGREEWVDKAQAHPLARALRVDGVTYAALEATLEAYASGDASEIPFWQQVLVGDDELAERADRVAVALGGEARRGGSDVGAGSAPGTEIPTWQVWLHGRDDLYTKLLALPTPVLARRQDGALLIDVRTVPPDMDQELISAIERCL